MSQHFRGKLSLQHALVAAVAAVALLQPAVVAVAADATADPVSIIPNPATLSSRQGAFSLSADTAIIVPAGDRAAARAADQLRDLVRRTHGLLLGVKTGKARDAAINFVTAGKDAGGPEAYRLETAPERITVTAAGARGLLYGGISLWQLLPATDGTAGARIAVPAVAITDAPRFAWRGIMLDSARHYQSPEFIHRFIDWMVLHKLNVLHWHLTDDQAWRLEIRKYPALTKVSAWRVPAGPAAQADIDPATGKPRLYGGFYSQKTVREIVRYAAARGIDIVPEIDLPGHATAALAAYPALAAIANPPTAASPDWGIFPNTYNLEEPTFRFLEDVLTEVMALFPGKHIHLGGDEVEKQQWKQSASVQQRMRALGLKDETAVQTYFMQRLGRFLQKHGRRLVGWDEVLEPGLPASTVVMSWRGIDGALAAAAKSYDTVLSPWPTLYFDNRQSDAIDQPPGRGQVISLENVYRFEPMPEKLVGDQRKHVLGLQGNVWTEHIRTEERVAAMAFPRAAAVAELGWSLPERRSWPDFVRRMGSQMQRYRALQIPVADSAFAVQAETGIAGDHATVTLSTQTGAGEIRYTVDGSEPTPRSPRYQTALSLPLPAEIRATAFADGLPLARARAFPLRAQQAQQRASRQLKLCSENIAIALEDDAPVGGPRAIFLMDIQNPCWIFPKADLDGITSVTAAVGQVPFNFQIGEAVRKIQFATPQTASGELEVHLGDCKGEVIARLPLAPALGSNAVTLLPSVPLSPRSGKHDLCLRFAQSFADWTRDPIWALDSIRLNKEAADKK